MRMSVRLSLPRDASWVSQLRGIAGCLLQKAGTPADDVADLQLALTEACANVVRHAVGTDSYTVGLVVEPAGCEVEIVDLGPGFDETMLDDGDEVDDHAETGRGLDLMQALVDDLELRADAAATRLVLRKWWSVELDSAAVAAVDAESVTLTIDGLTATREQGDAGAGEPAPLASDGSAHGADATSGDGPGAADEARGAVKERVQRSRPFRPGEHDPAWAVGHDGGRNEPARGGASVVRARSADGARAGDGAHSEDGARAGDDSGDGARPAGSARHRDGGPAGATDGRV